MEPISLILGALLAGATKGAGEASGTAIKDAYAGLRDALKRRFTAASPSRSQPAETALTGYLSDPDAWRPALETYLRQAAADKDQEIIDAAVRVMAAADPDGARAGKYTIDLTGAQGVQVGDHNTQTNHFGGPPS